MPGVDPTQVDFVRLILSGSAAGSWEIRDVRTVGPPAPVPILSVPAAVAVTVLLAGTALFLQHRRLRVVR
jgi:hypothetical protein